jgi:hypothetical protein
MHLLCPKKYQDTGKELVADRLEAAHQWFIKVSPLKTDLVTLVPACTVAPDHIGTELAAGHES